MKSCLRIFVAAVSLMAFAAGAVDAQTTATVSVDCSKNKSINKALEQHPNADSLIVEIQGLCRENVVVTRDRVTLRGANPSSDGIQADINATQMDAALWVRGAHQVVVENLKLTGGFAGLLASEVSTPSLKMNNCRSEGNTAYGVILQSSLAELTDTVLTANGNFNAGIFGVSRIACLRCSISNPLGSGALGTQSNNIIGLSGPTVIVIESTLTGGGILLTNGLLQALDSAIEAPAPTASVSGSQSIINMTRVQVIGPMRFNASSTAVLLGVTQPGGGTTNQVDDNSFVRIAAAPPATGGPPTIPSSIQGFSFQNFSTGSLLGNSQINGNFNCLPGANAFCAITANVSGTSNCSLCPKP
ncbi:MAG TPA: hypothetical protein VJZ26_15875 [Blastocatellia bacterium]|nr:hypothetical protein [Blastocatellia bacterium]